MQEKSSLERGKSGGVGGDELLPGVIIYENSTLMNLAKSDVVQGPSREDPLPPLGDREVRYKLALN